MTDEPTTEPRAVLGPPPEARGAGPMVRGIVTVIVLAVGLALPFINDNTSTLRMLSLGFVMAIGAMGLNVLTGYTGQISIGHAAFYGIGAYITANLIIEQNLTFITTIPISILVTAACGALVGLPALRVKGPSLALVTLGIAILVPTLLLRFGSSSGMALWKPKRRYLGSPIDSFTDTQWKYLLPLIALVIVFFLTKNLVSSRAGRSLVAVRDQETAAATAGVNVAGTKIAAFALSAAYCGLAGSLSVLVRGQADAASALSYFQMSIYFLVAVVIGGTATIAGPVLGGILVEYLLDKAPEWSGGRVGMAPFILGSALVVIVYVLPGGIAGGVKQLATIVKRRLVRSEDPGPNESIDHQNPAEAVK